MDTDFSGKVNFRKYTVSHLEHGWGGEGEMGVEYPRQLIFEAVREMVGQPVNRSTRAARQRVNNNNNPCETLTRPMEVIQPKPKCPIQSP